MSGTQSMRARKQFFNAVDICNIIKVCGEAGVSDFRVGDFSVSFGKSSKHTASNTPEEAISVEQVLQAERSLAQAEAEIKEDQLNQMLIEDPFAAEELIMSGEFTNAKGEN